MKTKGLSRWITILVMIVLLLGALAPARLAQGASLASTAPLAAAAPAAFDCSGVTAIPLAECQALVALYQGTGGTGWTNSAGWLTTTTPCSWYGVTCTSGHVTALNLYSNLLKGPLPASVAGLTNLTSLVLALLCVGVLLGQMG